MKGVCMDKYEKTVESWQSQKIERKEDLDVALNNFRILFAYHSNAIENPQTTYHDTREIFENGQVINYTGDLRTLLEIENQKNTYDALHGHIISHHPITPELIKKFHKLLMRGCYDQSRYDKGERPGEFKQHDYVTGDNVGAKPDAVLLAIKNLCDELETFTGDPITAAAYFHLNFESIHPFADGNGRVGRTLMNYYLMIRDYPPTIIYNEDKKTYYLGLSTFDHTGNIDGFIQFLKEQTIKTWDRQPIKRKSLEQYTKAPHDKSELER